MQIKNKKCIDKVLVLLYMLNMLDKILITFKGDKDYD